MTEQVSHAQILKAIAELKAEMRSDSSAMWGAITKLNDQVSMGKGGVKVIAWLGGIMIAVCSMSAALYNAFRPH